MPDKNYTSQRADIETSSDDYAMRFSGESGKYFLDTQKNITLRLLDSFRGASVLDVGGGHGQLAVPLVQNGYQVTVVGSSPECRKRLDDQLKSDSFSFKIADLLNLPFEEKSFDIVIAFRLLPHEENWENQIRELCRVAKYGVIIDYPDIRSFNSFYSLLFSFKKKVEVDTRQFLTFNRKQIRKAFEGNGFSKKMVVEGVHKFSLLFERAFKGA